MPFIPVALYGLEVPSDAPIVAANSDFPATLRITMAAIDPDQEIKSQAEPRATLKIIREQNDPDSDDSEEYMRTLLGSESEDESDGDNNDSGPSDPSKSKKSQKAAALKQLMDSISKDDSDEELEDAHPEDATVNGVKTDKKGKAKASSDDDNDSDSSSDDEFMLEEFVVCTLDPKKNYQQPLDITIGENENVFFKVTGTHSVYLTGNYLIPDDLGLNNQLGGEGSDDDGEYDLSPDEDELGIESDEESDELDDLGTPRITEVESEDDAKPQTSKVIEKKKGKNKRSADEIQEENSLDSIMAKSLKPEPVEEPKLSKKQLKKLKKNNGQATVVKTEESKKNETEKSDKNDRKVQFAKNLEQGPSGATEKGKSEQANNQKKPSLGIKTVDGVKIDDKTLGSGRACKKGDKVFLRYIGKLTNGTVFDSNKKGTPFSFKLGTGEVIRGWDIGVTGMSPGGERRITVPANKGYGNKSMPGIPANSILIFDIKLLDVK